MGRKSSLVSIIRSPRVIRLRAVRSALFLVMAACQLFGQIDRGTIQGVVKDQSGGVVPDAKVLVIQTETNSAIELRTNSEGAYVAPNLPAAKSYGRRYPQNPRSTGLRPDSRANLHRPGSLNR